MNTKRREYMVDVLPKRRILMQHGKSLGNQDMTAYITTPEENHRCEGRVASLRIGLFQKLSGGREDKSYKGNKQTF